MTREDLLELIRDAGFPPVERNTRYEVVREYDPPMSLASAGPSRSPWTSDPSQRPVPSGQVSLVAPAPGGDRPGPLRPAG